MPFLFIIVAVLAIVIYSAKHNLGTLSAFLEYVHQDLVGAIIWVTAALVSLVVIGLMLGMFRRKG